MLAAPWRRLADINAFIIGGKEPDRFLDITPVPSLGQLPNEMGNAVCQVDLGGHVFSYWF
jgi:hypothetical protein